jgi:hypothetical protein
MKNVISKITGVVGVYRSVASPGFASNLRSAVSFVVAIPSVFIMPVFHCIGLCFTSNRALASTLAPLSLINLLISPLLVVYVIALPFFERRLYLTTPAGRALAQVQRQAYEQMKEQNGQA